MDGNAEEKPFNSSSPSKPQRFTNLASISAVPENAEFDSELPETISASIRKRVQTPEKTIEPGCLNVLSATYESLDYDVCENHLLLEEERKNGYNFVLKKNIARWVVFLLIGMFTALIACIIDISIEELSKVKYHYLSKSVDANVLNNKLYISHLLWIFLNVLPVFIGSALVAYVEPIAAGSGIPQVRCYLNGVKVPRVVRFKTLFVKTVGVICSVVGGLAGGKEGPMIHAGAVVAAGISQGQITSYKMDFGLFKYFREDHEKRDFVSGGAAAGVSAAFGAPVGGVLFSLEEGTSFWNQALTWKTLFASVISTFTLNSVLSAYHGHLGDLSYPGLLNLGRFEPFSYELYELPFFVLMGAFGGLCGAAWNQFNYKMAKFRIRYMRRRWVKVLEACLVAALTAAIGFLMMYFINDCKPLGDDPTSFPTQLFCGDGEYNVPASIWFQTPEASLRSLLHDPSNTHDPYSLAVFLVFYFAIACLTFGTSTSIGLFIPTLLTGAAWGRIVSVFMLKIIPDTVLVQPGKYALIGAAAQLGGVVRMTISLTVIIIETTGNVSFALPLIITLIAAKWTGDLFNEGVYDTIIQLNRIPLLPWEPPPLVYNLYASEVMSHPVVTLKSVENVAHIVELLKLTTYNGFPIVDPPLTDQHEVTTYGRLRGLILRSQLIVILQRKLFNETAEWWDEANVWMFRKEYPQYPTIDQISVSDQEKTYHVDLRPFMNQSPYTVLHSASLPRMFRIFRGLGLRHLPVVNDSNEVVGMVTRKDIARYRLSEHGPGIEELLISKDL